MMKVIKVAMVAIVLAACAARPAVQATPGQRAQAVAVLIHGGTLRDVAAELALSDADARRLVRSTIKDLMHGLQRSGR